MMGGRWAEVSGGVARGSRPAFMDVRTRGGRSRRAFEMSGDISMGSFDAFGMSSDIPMGSFIAFEMSSDISGACSLRSPR